MVDTIHCSSEADLTEAFFYKLLLGAIDKVADHNEISSYSRDRSERERQGRVQEERPAERAYQAQTHSDPQVTTLNSLPAMQTSTHPRQSLPPRFLPPDSQQHSTWHQRPDQQYSFVDDPRPVQLSRHSTLPQRAELPMRNTMRSSTLNTKQSAPGWRPPS